MSHHVFFRVEFFPFLSKKMSGYVLKHGKDQRIQWSTYFTNRALISNGKKKTGL